METAKELRALGNVVCADHLTARGSMSCSTGLEPDLRIGSSSPHPEHVMAEETDYLTDPLHPILK